MNKRDISFKRALNDTVRIRLGAAPAQRQASQREPPAFDRDFERFAGVASLRLG